MRKRAARLPSLATMALTVFENLGQMVERPLRHRLAGLHKRDTTRGEMILHARRHLGIDRADNQSVFLQGAQGGCQHLLGDVGDATLQGREPERLASRHHTVHDEQRSLVSHPRQHIAHGAGRKHDILYIGCLYHYLFGLWFHHTIGHGVLLQRVGFGLYAEVAQWRVAHIAGTAAHLRSNPDDTP